jgi:hypothetical protein
MDSERLSVALYQRTGLAIDPTDPMFAVVELNKLVLEETLNEAAERLAQRLETLPHRIETAGKALFTELGAQGTQRVVEMLQEARRVITYDVEQAQRRIAEHNAKLSEALTRQVAQVARAAQTLTRAGTVHARWLLATAAVGLVSCICGFMGGQIAAACGLLWLSVGR